MPISFGRAGVGLGSYYGNRVLSPYTGVVLLDGEGNVIGGMTSFDIRSDRRNEPIRIIDLFNAGRIFERALQPEEIRITGNAILLYYDAPPTPNSNTSIVDEDPLSGITIENNFGIGSFNFKYNEGDKRAYYGSTAIDRLSSNDVVAPFMFLNAQFAPFDLIVFNVNPSRGKGVGVKFIDCYIGSYGASYRIETAYVAESVEISPTSWELVRGDNVLELLNISAQDFEKYLLLKRLATQ